MKLEIEVVIEKNEITDEKCPKCSKPMVIRTGRFGRFMACSDYPACKTTKAISIGVACPEQGCNGMLVEKRTKKGKPFYSCSNYPNCKYAIWDKPIPDALSADTRSLWRNIPKRQAR